MDRSAALYLALSENQAMDVRSAVRLHNRSRAVEMIKNIIDKLGHEEAEQLFDYVWDQLFAEFDESARRLK